MNANFSQLMKYRYLHEHTINKILLSTLALGMFTTGYCALFDFIISDFKFGGHNLPPPFIPGDGSD